MTRVKAELMGQMAAKRTERSSVDLGEQQCSPLRLPHRQLAIAVIVDLVGNRMCKLDS